MICQDSIRVLLLGAWRVEGCMASGFWKKSKVIMCLVDTLCLLSARQFWFPFCGSVRSATFHIACLATGG